MGIHIPAPSKTANEENASTVHISQIFWKIYCEIKDNLVGEGAWGRTGDTFLGSATDFHNKLGLWNLIYIRNALDILHETWLKITKKL